MKITVSMDHKHSFHLDPPRQLSDILYCPVNPSGHES